MVDSPVLRKGGRGAYIYAHTIVVIGHTEFRTHPLTGHNGCLYKTLELSLAFIIAKVLSFVMEEQIGLEV
jgi:hypothetical protein